MTSFIISSHVDRKVPGSWSSKNDDCVFCQIIYKGAPSYTVFETEKVVAILDIAPLRPGHVLVIPKEHHSHLSELPEELAGALGQAVSKLANALTKAMENNGLNVVCNQEYAQAVPHVHYHIVPAPTFDATSKISVLPTTEETRKYPLSYRDMHRMEFEARGRLEEDDALELVQRIKSKL
ncbi:HIT-like protein [Fomitiporia mediterranea MF3/22]|uniref:HIT-like protein n=1 Tax=Fomitiporia mediterranea (strain MF3/22) TaxID=694068 RepID=UPI00044085C5|nr:HIT-like protein [Fomitiporia mediterranea MF3/22]EJC97969.1 HIT-like protein [Fomitiporia mediterranea MF3/22]